MADTSPAPELPEDKQEEVLYFFLYFAATCLSIFFLILLVFLCFSGRICVYICYIVHKVQPRVPERAPLIIETDYFPRPGYDGYCLLGQEEPLLRNNNSEEPDPEAEDTRRVLMEAGLLLTRSIDIDLGPRVTRVVTSGSDQPPLLTRVERERPLIKPSDGGSGSVGQSTPSNYPRGILTPERRRALRRNGESIKAVSFNPRTECLLLKDI